MNINNPRRYDDDLHKGRIEAAISPESANRLHNIDRDRAKFLGKLVTSNVLKLGGKSRKRSNKNKKKYTSSSRRRYNKKCRKSAKRN
jgi:hypothetical protein